MENLYLDFIFEIESLYEVDPDKELLLSAKNEAGKIFPIYAKVTGKPSNMIITLTYLVSGLLLWRLDKRGGNDRRS